MDKDASAGGPIILGFAGNGFRTHEATWPALLLTTERETAWAPPPLAALTVEALGDLLDSTPEFLLLGTGAGLVRPPAAFVRAVEALGLGVEAMDSRAAARAWGVLRGEGRVIAAALYPLDA